MACCKHVFRIHLLQSEWREWAELEDITPGLILKLPNVLLIKNNKDLYEGFMTLMKRIFPLPQPPQRSDDFLADKNIFDIITDKYVDIFGLNFAYWYQDIFINRQFIKIKDPVERLWYQARNYDLFGRLEKAEPIYFEILNNHHKTIYYERTVFFLSLLLIHRHRYCEAKELLHKFLIENSDTGWRSYVNFYLALCYEKLGDVKNAIQYYEQVNDEKLYVDAIMRLTQLFH